MAIQWFPGHMHKAQKELRKVLPDADAAIVVCDARLPFSSFNPMLADILGELPLLYVLTRNDLADATLTPVWLEDLSAEAHRDALAVVATDKSTTTKITERLDALLPPMSRSRVRPRQILVAGIPNVGKSTLINTLSGRAIAATGNEPAVTRRQQNITLDNGWQLRDTPGMLWPKVENEASGYRLAASGAVRDTAMDSAEVACWLLDYLSLNYSERLSERYDIKLPLADSVAILDAIGQQRGCLGAGGLVDFDRAGRLLLGEFRQGLLGGITLETPSMRDQELAETQVRLAAIAERRAQRKSERKAKFKRR